MSSDHRVDQQTGSSRDRILVGGFIAVVLTLIVLRGVTWEPPKTRNDVAPEPLPSTVAEVESLPAPGEEMATNTDADATNTEIAAPRVRLTNVNHAKFREPTAPEVLKKMIAAYQAARGYVDRGKLSLRYKQRGEVASESWPMVVQFYRPGRLRIDAYQLHVVSDHIKSKKFLARVEDATTNNIDQQVVSRDAPAKITLDELSSDPILMTQLASRLQRPPVQLEMLLAEKPLNGLFGEDTKLTLLPKGDVDKAACRRVEAATPDGKFVFWVDEKSYVLRRVEFPAGLFMPEAAADPTVSELTLVAHLSEARFVNDDRDLDLTFAVPAKAKLVRAFVPPPVETAPHLLGRRLPALDFTTTRGKKISTTQWRGKPTAMMWFMAHPACEAGMKQFALAAKTAGDDVRYVAVCTDPSSTPSATIEKLLGDWKVDVEWIRDSEAHGESTFKIDAVPALVVANADTAVQLFVVQGDPNLGQWLPDAMKRIASGEDMAGEIKKREKEARDTYEKLIAGGGMKPGSQPAPVALEPKKPAKPRSLNLDPLWTCADLKSPGNVTIVPEGRTGWRVLALDGFRTLVEIDSAGKVLKRHELDLPERAAVTSLRMSPVKGSAVYFAAFAPMGPQMFVFDRNFRLKFAYPASAEDAESPIRDVQLGDLKNEGDPVAYVAFADASGLHGLDSQGKRAWRSRAYDPLFSIAVSPRDELLGQRLLVTGRGGVMPVNGYGNNDPEVRVPNWVVGQIITGKFEGAKQAAVCALAVDEMERGFAVGLDPRLAEQWNYPLPPGPFAKPVDPVVSGPWLDGKGHWVFAGPEGSLHVVAEDGEFSDFMATGEHLAGLAIHRAGGESLLFVATDKGVTAYRVTPK